MSTELVEFPQGRLGRPSLLAAYSRSDWDELAEQSVLGGVLVLPNLVVPVRDIVQPEDFFLPCHQKILAAILRLAAEKVPIDLITVGEVLEGDPEFEAKGGRNYLSLLPNLSVPALHSPEHARVVRRHALRRRIKEVAWGLDEGSLTPADAQAALRQLEASDLSRGLPLLTAKELCAQTPERPDWVVEGYVARELVTELTAKVKTGKTHFAVDLVARVIAGEPFLDKPTTSVPTVYLTEERASTFRSALARVGLTGADDLRVLQRRHAPGTWPAVAQTVLGQAKRLGAGLVVCDTLSDWSGLSPEEENDSAAALEAMRPLQAMADAGLAVLVLRHERKAGGEVGDSARGSSAFGGAADILLSLTRAAGQGHENRRKLEAVGRLDDIPPRLLVEAQDHRYVALGEALEVETREARNRLLEVLPHSGEEAVSEKALLERLGEGVKRSSLKRALGQLLDEGKAERRKRTIPGSPTAYGYWLTEGPTP